VLGEPGGQPVPLVSPGYDDRIRAYGTSPAAVAETELAGLHRARPPMCLRDFQVPPTELRGWAEYLRPAGFRGHLGVPLFAPDGRHLGQLTLNTETAAHPTNAARDLIGTLAPLIGHAVDPLRSPRRRGSSTARPRGGADPRRAIAAAARAGRPPAAGRGLGCSR
jgi:GAF domain-containing protein